MPAVKNVKPHKTGTLVAKECEMKRLNQISDPFLYLRHTNGENP